MDMTEVMWTATADPSSSCSGHSISAIAATAIQVGFADAIVT
jgi:hypothetical protein